jgi:hypothetical protein
VLEGGCYCGAIRYVAGDRAYDRTNCHCSICRRVSGAPFVAWFTVAAGELRWLAGEPTTFRSSDHATRTFCARCGTPLTFRSTASPDDVDVTVGSLDHPERVAPEDETHVTSKVPWVQLDPALPKYPGRRTR